MTHSSPTAEEIRRLIRESKLPLTELATLTGVRYHPLWKWVTRRQDSYNLLEGERIYHFFTGRTFLQGGAPKPCGGNPKLRRTR